MTELNNPEFGSAKLGRKALKDAVRILEGIGYPRLSKAQENIRYRLFQTHKGRQSLAECRIGKGCIGSELN